MSLTTTLLLAAIAGIGSIASGIGLAWTGTLVVRILGGERSDQILFAIAAGVFVVIVVAGLVWIGNKFQNHVAV